MVVDEEVEKEIEAVFSAGLVLGYELP